MMDKYPYIYINVSWKYGVLLKDFYISIRCMEIEIQDVK